MSDKEFTLFLPLSKVEKTSDGGCMVAGYASTPSLDLDGEIVSLDAIKKALPGYWAWRNIREMHQPRAVGVAKEANVDGKGLFLTSKITDKDAVQKCLDEVYKGYSIGGRKLAKNGNVITEIDLVEISLVDRPANPDCRLEVQKSAKAAGAAHLVKMAKGEGVVNGPLAKALNRMSKVAEHLVKVDEPPAAHDGFSLPAKIIAKGTTCSLHKIANCPDCTCGKHNTVDCMKCAMKFVKRKFSAEARREAAGTGAALPDGSFPIENQGDLDNAVRLAGHAKDKGKARAHIASRAQTLGLKLPDSWGKFVKRLKKAARLESAAKAQASAAGPSFLTLSADAEDIVLGGQGKFRHGLAKGLRAEPRRDGSFGPDLKLKGLSKRERNFIVREDLAMTNGTNDLDTMLLSLHKAGKEPTRAQHFMAAKANMKKAKDMRKEAAALIKEVHAMHKAAYLAKQARIDLAKAGKKPVPDDDGDFDYPGAMSKLQKAFGALDAQKTFAKAAGQHLAKAAGNRGPLEGTDEYIVPPGIKSKSNSEMSREGPGGGTSGSEPPTMSLETLFPGKGAKGTYTAAEVALMMKNAELTGKVEALEKMPAPPVHGRRPAAFDTSKLFGANASENESLFKGVNPRSLESDDEETRKGAVGKVIGNMIMNGHGRSVFDQAFHGTAGASVE